MKKALILGTNAGQADIISYLMDNNWEVHSCGHKRTGPGCEMADFFHLVDTIDPDAVTELATKIKADIVYSVSSDSAIKTATIVSERLNLPVHINSHIINMFHHKEMLREFLNAKDINTVKFRKATSVSESHDWNIFPCVVKPSDSQGQRGIKYIKNKNSLISAVRIAIDQSNSGTAIIEEYLDGIEISTNTVVQDYKIIINEFTERIVHGLEYFGLPKGHSIPVRNVEKHNLNKASNLVEQLVKALEIKSAVLYIQMKVTTNGPKIIEVAPRLDGCHIWRLIKHAAGYDLRQYAIDSLLRIPLKETGKENLNIKPHTLKFYQQRTGTTFNTPSFLKDLSPVYNEFRYNDNEKVLPINGTLEVVGYFITEE